MTIKVGDALYRFDSNRRVYRRDGDGRATGGPIYQEHFICHQITGETPRSWLIEPPNGLKFKVSKKDLREAGKNGFGGHQWFTCLGMLDAVFVHEHRHKIVEKVRRETRASLLREIAGIVGYEQR